jgi:AcrR family transcriptional regulator
MAIELLFFGKDAAPCHSFGSCYLYKDSHYRRQENVMSHHSKNALIDALFHLAKDQPWSTITITAIAEEAKMSLSDFRDHFPSKEAILGAFVRRIDQEVLQQQGETPKDEADSDESHRERLFAIWMQRFDALAPYKQALRSIARSIDKEPATLLALNGVALNSQRFMLEAAGIHCHGPLGALKLQASVLLFQRVMKTWLQDHSEDQSKTLKALDEELGRAEMISGRMKSLNDGLSSLRHSMCGWRKTHAEPAPL